MKKPLFEESPPQQSGAPEWMLTYGDMVTLLLCLFVLLFAYSTINLVKFEELQKSLRDTFNLPLFSPERKGRSGLLKEGGKSIDNDLTTGPIPRVVRKVKNHIMTTPLKNKIDIAQQQSNIKITLSSQALFQKASSKLANDKEDVLFSLVPIFKEIPYKRIRFIGHTDSDPIGNSDIYPSNWELSCARAAAVARFYIEYFNLPPEKIAVEGRASYEPIAPNDTEEGKAKNRRVEIIVETSEAKLLSQPHNFSQEFLTK